MNTAPYLPGLHLLATLQTAAINCLQDCEGFRQAMEQLITTHSLTSLGAVYHSFPQAGFTAVICLSESHVSVHTWPEHGLANIDVYLSNYERTNDGTVREIFEGLTHFFEATVAQKTEIFR